MRLKSSGYGSKFWQYNGIIHSRSRFLSYSSMALKKAWGFVIILLICRLHITIIVATIVGTLEAKSTESSDATMNLMSEWQGPKSLMRRSSAHFLRALDGAGFLIKWKWNLMKNLRRTCIFSKFFPYKPQAFFNAVLMILMIIVYMFMCG